MSSKKANTHTDRSNATKPKSGGQRTPTKYAPKEGFKSAGKCSTKPKSVNKLLTIVGHTITQAATVIVDQVNRLLKPASQPSPKNINYDKENPKSANKGKSGKRCSRSRQDVNKRSSEGKQTKILPKSNRIFFDIELTQPRNGYNNHRLVKRFGALPRMEPTGKAANYGSHIQQYVTRKTSQGKVEAQKPSSHFSSPPILRNKSKGAAQTSIPTRWNTTNPKLACDKTKTNSF